MNTATDSFPRDTHYQGCSNKMIFQLSITHPERIESAVEYEAFNSCFMTDFGQISAVIHGRTQAPLRGLFHSVACKIATLISQVFQPLIWPTSNLPQRAFRLFGGTSWLIFSGHRRNRCAYFDPSPTASRGGGKSNRNAVGDRDQEQ
ncbi:MAG: hypothetical protein R3D67_12385 [Hyphomicrobiaceae bacterium]